MPTLNERYNESKKYSHAIMDTISDALDRNNIQYTKNTSGTEIVVNNKVASKKDIQRILDWDIGVPEVIRTILIKVTEVNNDIYIRQITK